MSYPPYGYLGPRAIAMWAIRTRVAALDVVGLQHLPATGPVMIVARHYHHLLDGAVLVDRVRRPVHIVVGLDWARDRRERTLMESACRAAGFPIVLRRATLHSNDGRRRAYSERELFGYTRNALHAVSRLLRAERVVAVFPEAYPNVDPHLNGNAPTGTRPFERGFATMVAHAERDRRTRVAVVPVGFAYTRAGKKWNITARFGTVVRSGDAREIEAAVSALSQPA